MNEIIRNFIINYVKNYPQTKGTQTAWQEPLTAFAHAENPIFTELKDIISPNHFLPQDLLPQAQSVICYFLPYAQDIGINNSQGEYSTHQWALAYVETNQLIQNLNTFLKEQLQQKGFHVATTPATHNFDETELISYWSHRHIGVIAGLGALGLNHMLITQKGCCGRLGSLVTDMPLESTPPSLQPSCLYYYDKSCGICLEKCDREALTKTNFDRFKCYDFLRQNAELHKEMGDVTVCGKCLSRVPCSFTDPVRRLKEKATERLG